ncbi:MAG TPA: tetratricopeptide repeat protein, partial [Polyangiales bacterium]|nr:tetratricopeptide repeat protein [Polyangiales bacterium]
MMIWGRAFAIVSLLLLARPLRAEDSADALISQGVALRKQGKNAEALVDFQRAYQISPSPRAQAQIALAEQALGDWIAAEDGLVSALA